MGNGGVWRHFDAVHDLLAQGAGTHAGGQVWQRGIRMAMLEVKDLSIHFGGVKAVQNVSFTIDAGIVYAVIILFPAIRKFIALPHRFSGLLS